jgi:hypothetical protein
MPQKPGSCLPGKTRGTWETMVQVADTSGSHTLRRLPGQYLVRYGPISHAGLQFPLTNFTRPHLDDIALSAGVSAVVPKSAPRALVNQIYELLESAAGRRSALNSSSEWRALPIASRSWTSVPPNSIFRASSAASAAAIRLTNSPLSGSSIADRYNGSQP